MNNKSVRTQLRVAGKGRSLLTPYPLTLRRQTTVTPPFSPLDIPDLQLWLDAADANTITEAGGVVTGWDDKSPASVGSGTFVGSPTYSTGAGGEVDFPDTYDSYMSYPVNTIPSEVADLTMFIVYKWLGHNDGGNQIFWGGDVPNGSNRVHFFTFPVFSAAEFTYNAGATTGAVSVADMDNSGTHLYVLTSALNVSNGSTIYLDQTLKATFTQTTEGYSDSRNRTLYFASGELDAALFNAHVRFHEILLYDAALSAGDRQKVTDYLTAKWNL